VCNRCDSGLTQDIDWYREATQWLVTLATGSVVVGLGVFKDATLGRFAIGLFSFACLLLLISIVAGILCHWWMISYAGHYQEALRSGNQDSKTKAARELRRGGRAFRVLLGSFLFGLATFALFVLSYLWSPRHPATSTCPVAVEAPAGGLLLVDSCRSLAWVVTPAELKPLFVSPSSPDLPKMQMDPAPKVSHGR